MEFAPELTFAIEGAEALEYAAVPTLRFRLRIESAGGAAVASVALNAQVRIAVRRRSYDESTRERLTEILGAPGPESGVIRSLFWTHATIMVPPFAGATTVELDVGCTYDFEVAVAKYFHALEEGEVPLEFLFSGSIFYPGPGGALRVGRIPWDREAAYRFPVCVWRTMMEQHFPNSAWVRLRRDTFDRLHTFRARRVLPGWEEAIEELLRTGGQGVAESGRGIANAITGEGARVSDRGVADVVIGEAGRVSAGAGLEESGSPGGG
jgi:hypothetical protein